MEEAETNTPVLLEVTSLVEGHRSCRAVQFASRSASAGHEFEHLRCGNALCSSLFEHLKAMASNLLEMELLGVFPLAF